MNGIAKELQLKRTKFTDPTGLRGNVSTAREMAIALRAALEDDVLREIMSDPYETVVAQGRHAEDRLRHRRTSRCVARSTT